MTADPTRAEIERLIAIAEKATPGPWRSHSRYRTLWVTEGEKEVIHWCGFDSNDFLPTQNVAISRHIAAANPATVLSLARYVLSLWDTLAWAHDAIWEVQQKPEEQSLDDWLNEVVASQAFTGFQAALDKALEGYQRPEVEKHDPLTTATTVTP